jgi:hypothetical protein
VIGKIVFPEFSQLDQHSLRSSIKQESVESSAPLIESHQLNEILTRLNVVEERLTELSAQVTSLDAKVEALSKVAIQPQLPHRTAPVALTQRRKVPDFIRYQMFRTGKY